MQVVYDKLFDKLKTNHLTQKDFKEKANISSVTLMNLRNNQSVTTETLCRICDYFQCMPDEIMEWIPDSDYEAKRKEKAEIEKQIAELQAKLKS